MTSSAASDTERARKRTSGWVASTVRDDGPPPPPGRWTSRSTTSGSRSRIISTAASTSDASPTTSTVVAQLGPHAGAEQVVVVDEEDPEAAVAHDALRGISSSTSVPSPGAGAHDRRAAVAGHPARDRLGDAVAVVGHRGAGRSPSPQSRTKTVTPLRLDLERTPTPCGAPDHGRVHHRLAGRGHQRLQAVVERGVPPTHHVDGHPVVVLDLGGRRRSSARAEARRRPSAAASP